MAGVVYSTRFGAGFLATGFTTFYTVPAGNVAVLRDITLGWGVAAGAGGIVTVQVAAGTSRIWVVTVPDSTVNSAHFQGNVVLPPGEQVRAAFTGTGQVYLTASGYLLTLP